MSQKLTLKLLVCAVLECDLAHEIDDSADPLNARLRFRCKRCEGTTPWQTMQGRTRAMLEWKMADLASKGIKP